MKFGFCELAVGNESLADYLFEPPAEKDPGLVLESVRPDELVLIRPAVDALLRMKVLVGSNALVREKLGWMVCVEQPLPFLTEWASRF